MREKSFNLHGNYDDFRLVYEYAKKNLTCMENTLKDIVETGNDLYNTAVRLQLILFSKDIGAF
jgi:hypothetical protein